MLFIEVCFSNETFKYILQSVFLKDPTDKKTP